MKRSRSAWEQPGERELEVIRDQIERAIADGLRVIDEPFDKGRWNGWVVSTRDLIVHALDGRWPEEFDDAFASPHSDDDPYAGYGLSAEDKAHGDLETRNGDLTAKISVARSAVDAISGTIARLRARPTPTPMREEDFGFMRASDLQQIARRDYAELRALDARSIKGKALLAGSVVEALVMDRLEANGIPRANTSRMELAELVKTAASQGVLKQRAAKAADAVRSMRNFVHPAVELRDGELREEDARAALALLDLVLADVR
ncbi:MAG: hypothetical protein M3P18_05970 [Actinomycetota bacterium]|nr:hypothetical protein [Actinomycetota bacterium]